MSRCCVEGKSLAKSHGSKYMEVSAILNHRVDELLVSALKQIRLCVGGHDARRRATPADRRPAAGDARPSTDADRPGSSPSTTTAAAARSRSPGALLSRLMRVASPRRT